MAPLSPLTPFRATFNPNPASGFQFTFTTDEGPVSNAFWVDDDNRTVDITLTNATFNEVPVIWSLPPGGGEMVPVVTMSPDKKTISFEVPVPDHLFNPWVFMIVVDFDGVKAVRSQAIYLAKKKELAGAAFTLRYEPGNGNFNLLDSGAESSQDGVIFANVLTMINVLIPPHDVDFTFTVTLDAPSDLNPVFSSAPVLWGSQAPAWLSATPNSMKELQFTLRSSAAGMSTGLQFSISIEKSPGESITILSPDPILINATIGDG